MAADPFWGNYKNTLEVCEVAEAGAPVVVAWPEFPWVAAGLTEGDQTYVDAYTEQIASNFGAGQRSDLAPTGSVQNTVPNIETGAPIQMLVQLDADVVDMPSLSATPTSPEIASWGPDTVDFFVEATAPVTATSVGEFPYVTHPFGETLLVVADASDQGDGIWRIRLSNLSSAGINALSNGDGVLEENGLFSDVYQGTGNFSGGLADTHRYYSNTVTFTIGGTDYDVQIGYISRFT